ncbi:hypothetical protein GDO81_022170 [Engystomops pustulosus]|uniref:Uncharacterized protein n=1 Tax=Engystomops pustulosus TaxID=76066 RepID=A0AAV6YXK0_ENGPU|nr:hypothetical protein GDO81_022170 [Engystomops pustulosus]
MDNFRLAIFQNCLCQFFSTRNLWQFSHFATPLSHQDTPLLQLATPQISKSAPLCFSFFIRYKISACCVSLKIFSGKVMPRSHFFLAFVPQDDTLPHSPSIAYLQKSTGLVP